MSTIKKLLALVLALTMVLSVSAAAAYTVIPYGDVAAIDADAEEAVQLLYSLGIMAGDDKGNFNPEATITRAEVAKMIFVILNYGKTDAKNYTGAKFFSDVEAGAWYEGYVNYAASIKLVQGRPDGTFGPNAPITCAEAAKMLLTAIGYSAEARGYIGNGWDTQVLSDASILGLLDGYNYNTQTYAPRQWVAVMFFNALTEALTYETIVPAVFNGLLTGKTVGDYTTMGDKYFDLYAWEGIITANEYANLEDDKDPLSADRTQAGKYLFKNWSTGLTEIGEYARGWATGSKVLYVTDDGVNTEFMTGAATDISTSSKFKSVSGIKQGGVEYVNFETGTVTGTNAGEWLRIVDNDEDGKADYVFKTTFTMGAYEGMDDDDIITISGTEFEDYELYADAAEDDIVIFTTIDGITYVELADSFVGEAAKYTYKTDSLTVDGEDYVQSGIGYDEDLALWALVSEAKKDTEYTFYQDFFGNIRLFGVDVADSGEFVLLTDAYYETNRNGSVAAVDAYLNGEIVDTDVRTSTSKTDIEMFIEDRTSSNNAWSKLIKFEGKTNLARYTMSDEGVMSLYDAETWSYKTNGAQKQIITQYIDLDNVDVKAGATKYEGTVVDVAINATTGDVEQVAGDDVTVQVNKNTVFYYIDADKNVKAVTGYKNSYDVVDEIVTIKAMYAVATNVEKDAAKAPYWVADVVVIETVTPVFNLKTNDIVLGFDIVNRTVNDYAYMDVVLADGTTDGLNVISHNGDDFDTFVKGDKLTVLNFFFNTENEDEDSYLVDLTAYKANDIYVGTVDRANKLYEYVTLKNGTVSELVYTDATIVYDIDDKGSYNKISTVSAGLVTGNDYIFFAPDGEIVYAILCEDTLTQDLYDVINGTAAGKAALAAAKEQWLKDIDNQTNWTDAEKAAAKAYVEAATDVAELTWELVIKAGYAGKVEAENAAAEKAAADEKTVTDAKAAFEGKTVAVTGTAVAEAVAAAVTFEGTTVVIELPDYTLAAGNGVKTIDGVTATFTAGEKTATATFSVKVTY